LVVTTAALKALNKELQQSVKMERFRPNVIIEGPSAYDEVNDSNKWIYFLFNYSSHTLSIELLKQ
jgi:uncharacterized protein YcbX